MKTKSLHHTSDCLIKWTSEHFKDTLFISYQTSINVELLVYSVSIRIFILNLFLMMRISKFCVLKLFLHIIAQTILDLSLPLNRSTPCFFPTTWTAGKHSCFLLSLRLATEWHGTLFTEQLPLRYTFQKFYLQGFKLMLNSSLHQF